MRCFSCSSVTLLKHKDLKNKFFKLEDKSLRRRTLQVRNLAQF